MSTKKFQSIVNQKPIDHTIRWYCSGCHYRGIYICILDKYECKNGSHYHGVTERIGESHEHKPKK